MVEGGGGAMTQEDIISPRVSQRGFDAPIFDPSGDSWAEALSVDVSTICYARQTLISRSELDSPATGGVAKHLSLGWVETYAIEDGHKIVWYNPWSVTSIDSLWLTFYETLRNGLEMDLTRETASDRSLGLLRCLKASFSSNAETLKAMGQSQGSRHRTGWTVRILSSPPPSRQL